MAIGYMLLFMMGTCGNVAVLSTVFHMVTLIIHSLLQLRLGAVKTSNSGQHSSLCHCFIMCRFWRLFEPAIYGWFFVGNF
jgi:hypothetical protein